MTSSLVGSPAAAVNPEHHGQILRAGGRVHIEHLTFVRRGVRDIECHTLGVRFGDTRDGDEEQAGEVFHRVLRPRSLKRRHVVGRESNLLRDGTQLRRVFWIAFGGRRRLRQIVAKRCHHACCDENSRR